MVPSPSPSPSRYPSTLSHSTPRGPTSGPSRPYPPARYPAPSIDSSISSPPSASSVPLHEYSSLADLLQQAGYKETRVFTPEAEKFRSRIKKTLDDDNEDEINALYGTYGFDRHGVHAQEPGAREVRHHITEPGLPMKTSSSILRSLAYQDAASSLPRHAADDTSEHSWWSPWGRSTKAHEESPASASNSNSSFEAPTEVGLGLAKGGEGVRKVRSAWELDKSRPRRAGTDSPPQEDRTPRHRVSSSPTDVMISSAVGYTYTPTKQPTKRTDKDLFSSPPPPAAVDEDAYGYCPLPEDYEAECTEDEAMYAMGVNDYGDIYSLGSSSSSSSPSPPGSGAASLRDTASILSSASERSRTRSETEERAVREIQEFQDEMAMIDEVNQVGKRILQDAVDYDDLEYDSPDSHPIALPDVDSESNVPSIPIPPTPTATATRRNPRPETEPEAPPTPIAPSGEETKKPMKYGDRATRLRIAHSTPALRQSALASTSPAPPLPAGWLGSIRSALVGRPVPTSSSPVSSNTNPTAPPFTSQPKGPIRISPITPALPSLVTASPVICDSSSTEAEDLPPVPSPPIIAASESPIGVGVGITSLALRLRPSLAKLRNAVLGSSPLVVEETDSPMLSPRLDWGEQGEQFAGWSPAKSKSTGQGKDVVRDPNEGGIDALFGPLPSSQTCAQGTSPATNGEDIDYTKSFFYKPTTPPKPSATGTSGSASAPSTPPKYERPGMRKQRSIKSLKAALLLPVAPAPPVPALPAHLTHLATPRKVPAPGGAGLNPPILAIQSPGAWAPRELVLEGEEWDAREGSVGDWGRGRGKGRASRGSGNGAAMRRRKSKKVVRD